MPPSTVIRYFNCTLIQFLYRTVALEQFQFFLKKKGSSVRLLHFNLTQRKLKLLQSLIKFVK